MKKTLFLVFLLLFLLGCDDATHEFSKPPIKHKEWQFFLNQFVSSKGEIDYIGINKKPDLLTNYVASLSGNHPNKNWTLAEKKAYWLNAYNAFAIQLIIRNYPIKSIKEAGIFGVPWYIDFIKIEGMSYDLNTIEHAILRKEFNDPRIHFSIVCASKSCPRLCKTAFTSSNLDSLLNSNSIAFVNDTSRNTIEKTEIKISKIFKWFATDFTTDSTTIIDYLNKYSEIKINKNATVKYRNYDWSLNGK